MKRKTLISSKKARVIILKIIEMIEKNNNSINIMQKNVLAYKSLKLAQKNLLKDYFVACFDNGIMAKSKIEKEKTVKEILKAMRLSKN